MDFLLDKIPERSPFRISASQFALPELPNTLAFKLLSEAITKIDHVVSKIFENIQQLRIEHNRESKRLALLRQEHAQDDNRIFESKNV